VTDPYYADDSVTLWHADLRDNTIWATVDVLVVDPPYGIGYQSKSRSTRSPRIQGDRSAQLRDTITTLWGPDRPAIVFGHWRTPAPAGERQRLIWWKQALNGGRGDLAMPWGTSHEDIHVLGRNWPPASTRHGSVITTTAGMGGTHGVVNTSGHPTAKPVPLLERLIAACPPGTIADPCAGSGTTLIAARNLGRHAVGVEIDERWCELAARRLAQGALAL